MPRRFRTWQQFTLPLNLVLDCLHIYPRQCHQHRLAVRAMLSLQAGRATSRVRAAKRAIMVW